MRLNVVRVVGVYVVCLSAVAGGFVLVAIGKASWGEVGPLVSAVVLGLAGIHASALGSSATPSPGSSAPAETPTSSSPAGVGAAGSSTPAA